MSGSRSRDKGARGERNLVAELKKLGWGDVLRVPLSGASQGFKGDVLATQPKTGRLFKFELKCRADAFDRIYQFISLNQNKEGVASALLGERGFKISRNLDQLLLHNTYSNKELLGDQLRTARGINNKRALLGEADLLVLKQDRKDFIYIKFV